MNLVPVSVETIRINQPLPFSLMDKGGVLLARKSFVITSTKELSDIVARGGGLFIDAEESEAHLRDYVVRLHGSVRNEQSLGEIAGIKVSGGTLGARSTLDNERPNWLDLQFQSNTLLRDSNASQFMERLERLNGQLSRHTLRNPDGTLFALIYLSASETGMYSATHAMLVSVICGLACRDVLNWPPEQAEVLCKAAFTMNLGMTELQDRLARQVEPLWPDQRKSVHGHAEKSASMLMELGVTNADWLQAVREHHTQKPGPLGTRTWAQRMARMMHRADMFAARLAPRTSRVPTASAAAMQACYFDENKQIDEAGAALIKAVGIYQPGSFVRLATDEVAIVIKRGINTTTPRVAVLINRTGLAMVEATVRETSVREYRIIASVAHRDVKVQINLERLLPLTAAAGSDRTW